MTRDSVECFNCGRENPPWAQVCRFCGVPLRPATEGGRALPAGLFPTDQHSLLSMGAAVGTIVVAVVVGLLASSLNPVDPSVGLATPTPRASIVAPPPSIAPIESSTPEPPTPTPTPALPARVTFGTERSTKTCEIGGQTDTFESGQTFAHSISVEEPFGVSSLIETVSRVADDGSESLVQKRDEGGIKVNSKAKIACYAVKTSSLLLEWDGPGTFVLRVYKGDELIGEGSFKLTE
jgi:hypothetical protein